MNYIVIDKPFCGKLIKLKKTFDLKKTCSDFEPIEIENNLFILPLSVLQDKAFRSIFLKNKFNGDENKLLIREVSQNEFKIDTE